MGEKRLQTLVDIQLDIFLDTRNPFYRHGHNPGIKA